MTPSRDSMDHGLDRRTFLRRTGSGMAAFGLAPALLAACGGSPSASSSPASGAGTGPARGGRLRVGLNDGGSTDSLAPWNTPSYNAFSRATQVYERLYQPGSEGTPVPILAESAEANAGATVWQVKLRAGVTFHDGKPFTANDVLYSFRYIADPKNKAESLSIIEPLDLAASKAVSDTELEIRLNRPIGDLPGLLAYQTMWIAPEGATDFKTAAVGTGPFKFVEWQPGVRASYERNADYWQDGKPYVDELEIIAISDPAARLNALLGGQIDEMTFIDFVQAKAHESDGNLQIINAAQPLCAPIYVQIDSSPYDDVRVRQALRLAINRQEMIDKVYLGFGQLGNDLFGKGFATYNDELPQREYDPEQAASLLKAAGRYPLDLPLPTSQAAPGMLESATAFKEQAKAAGINVEIRKIDAGTHFANDLFLKTPVYQSSWGVSFEEHAQAGLLKTSPYNETHWYSPDWGRQFAEAQAIADPDQRNAAYQALQVPLYEEGGYILPAFSNLLDAASAKVGGIVPNISSGYSNLGGFQFLDHWLKS
ncbi:MAG: peptide/nickel transport system substrate-binding protein [Gaiellales bacterium]|nr:peptide/nickel transport system substrate-binding protein [Gaiellales bacterium]